MQPKNEKSLAVGVAEIVAAYVSHPNHGLTPEGLPKMILDLASAFKTASQDTGATLAASASPVALEARTQAPAETTQTVAPVAAASPVEAAQPETAATTEVTQEAASPARKGRKRGAKAAAADAVSETAEASVEETTPIAEATPETAAAPEEAAEEVAEIETPLDPLEAKFLDRLHVRGQTWGNMKPEDAIKPSAIVCLIDGQSRKMLHRHLKSKYGMTPQEYREWFNLPADYPMTAPGYSQEKSAYAREVGLGTSAFAEKAKKGTAQPETTEAAPVEAQEVAAVSEQAKPRATPKTSKRSRGKKAVRTSTSRAKANA